MSFHSRIGLIALFWLLIFAILPYGVLTSVSLRDAELAQPPYTALIDGAGFQGDLDNYRYIASDSLYADAYLHSLYIATVSTLACLLIAYPLAYAITRAQERYRLPLLMLVVLPFWTSFLIRVYAWIGLLKPNGTINQLLMGAGLIDQPLNILYTDFAVVIGISYAYLPFMVLPLYASLARLDHALLEAASDLGATRWQRFASITLPLSLPGIVGGCLLVFIPAVGEYVIPDLLGGPDSLMIGKLLWNDFFINGDWPLASAVAVVMMLILVIPLMLFERSAARATG